MLANPRRDEEVSSMRELFVLKSPVGFTFVAFLFGTKWKAD